MAKQPSRLFDAFALCGLGSDALVSLLGDEGIQAGPSARYRPSLLDRIPRATEGSEASCMAIPQHFPTVNPLSSLLRYVPLGVYLYFCVFEVAMHVPVTDI